MTRASVRPLVLAVVLLGPALAARSDTVKLLGKPPFRHVRVSGFREGRLIFRGVSRQYLRKPLEQIEWIELDACPSLGHAEHAAAAGQWNLAVNAYEQACRDAAQPWLANFTRLRFLIACDHAGAFDRAVAIYAELLDTLGRSAVPFAPRRPGPPGSSINARAVLRLREALAAGGSALATDHLRALLLELLLYEDVEPLPPELRPATQPSRSHLASTKRAASRPSRSAILGLPVAAPDVDTPRLSSTSFLLPAARGALDANDPTRAKRLLQRALPYVEPPDQGPWRLLLARTRLVAGQPAAAAADLLQLAEASPDPALAATALYYVAVAHERLARADVARRIYRELLQRDDLPAQVRADAAQALQRLGD